MLSQKEMKSRAEQFVRDFRGAKKENAETQTFYNEFFHIFGKRRRDVAVYERSVKKLGSDNTSPNRIDLLWPKVLLVEQKSAGKNLAIADKQALDYYLSLDDTLRPRYVMSCNFETIHLIDLEKNTDWTFQVSELPENISLFNFMFRDIIYDYAFEEKVSSDDVKFVELKIGT